MSPYKCKSEFKTENLHEKNLFLTNSILDPFKCQCLHLVYVSAFKATTNYGWSRQIKFHTWGPGKVITLDRIKGGKNLNF